ncbi:hypothetical protein LINPERHAP1_LOCUS27541 [Linum perenne]
MIACDSSDGRFGSVCRLSVSKGSVSHFIFLDRSSVLWLDGVLQVASNNRWKFPQSCSFPSVCRTVSVSSFPTSDGSRLKIAEKCLNGKTFYVSIPTDPDSGGWFGILRLVQRWIAEFLVPSPPPPPVSILPTPTGGVSSKSFARAVVGPCFSLQGRCIDFSVDGVKGVKVEDEGIADRIRYLDGCVTF